jgi:poly(A) polymerase Pap1
VTQLPPTDQAFDLSILSLTKLNSLRDLNYLQRTIPDLVIFCTAQRFIKTWAKQRGIYASRFGYLGGFHITLLLSRIYKLLVRNTDTVTVADIICTFFNHYASFDWSSEMVVDPDLYKTQMRYRRSAREAMVILSLHAPRVNVARTASLLSARTVIEELKRVDGLLSEAGVTWRMIIGDTASREAMTDLTSGAQEFLKSYKSYIKINVQFWGTSLAKGSSLLGWLESKCVVLLVGKSIPPSPYRPPFNLQGRYQPKAPGYPCENLAS